MNYTVIKITINNFFNLKVKGELQIVWYYESCILCAWNDIRDSTLWICFTFALLLLLRYLLFQTQFLVDLKETIVTLLLKKIEEIAIFGEIQENLFLAQRHTL